MNKKKTLGTNPLEAYLSTASSSSSAENTEQLVQPAHVDMHKKQRITIHLPIHVIERIKNVVYWEPGMTLTALAEQAFEAAVKELEQKRGASYPERKERSLKGGRPLV